MSEAPNPTTTVGRPSLVVLDFDGTMVESFETLTDLSLRALEEVGRRPRREAVRAGLGLPTSERFARLGLEGAPLRRAVAAFDRLHAESDYEDVVPVAGIGEWLRGFGETQVWVLSASPDRPVRSALERLGFEDSIDRVLTRARKVDALRELAARGELPRGQGPIWAFGDELSDYLAAAYLGAVFHLITRPHNADYRFLADRVLADFDALTAAPRASAPRNAHDIEHGIERDLGEDEVVRRQLRETARTVEALAPQAITALARSLEQLIVKGGTLHLAGNGGCHAVAEHFATDLRRVFATAGRGVPIVLLGASGASLSGVANDLGWERALWHELAPTVGEDDLVVLFSTSGRSSNLLAVRDALRERAVEVVEWTPPQVFERMVLPAPALIEDAFAASCHAAAFALRRLLLAAPEATADVAARAGRPRTALEPVVAGSAGGRG